MGAGKRILIVDDEPQIGDVLNAYLQREGFQTVFKESAESAREAVAADAPDLMILDINLPDGSGLDLLREFGAARGIPTLMLTARTDEVDRIVGLEMGADDYIIKPFSPREVVARVRAVFRRLHNGGPPYQQTVIHIRELELNVDARTVRMADRDVNLTRSEFDILRVLAESPERVFSRTQLLDSINDQGEVFERTLDRHINNLRKKLEPDPQHPAYVVTVYGVGYKLKR
ncbi:MAG: response regulator transcription factor [Candidatus Eremiobacteraeota bacterium]|nr:response regulator transcription factor [Candidatus Eremiobacteraeota bacterium]MBV9973295.1 response regulator transcription factor [Candidatus Eremiobacteraeota bacterium]